MAQGQLEGQLANLWRLLSSIPDKCWASTLEPTIILPFLILTIHRSRYHRNVLRYAICVV